MKKLFLCLAWCVMSCSMEKRDNKLRQKMNPKWLYRVDFKDCITLCHIAYENLVDTESQLSKHSGSFGKAILSEYFGKHSKCLDKCFAKFQKHHNANLDDRDV